MRLNTTKPNYIESSQLPESEKVYMKKDFMGWRIVHPVRNENGSLNWFNLLFGSKRNLVYMTLIIIFLMLLYLGYHETVSNYKTVMDDPCKFCKSCDSKIVVKYSRQLNLSSLDSLKDST